jgi:hypothetical protein
LTPGTALSRSDAQNAQTTIPITASTAIFPSNGNMATLQVVDAGS